ncbi:MAG: hypothetical protein ACOCYN_03195 [Planctomycetota bacterium]
MNDQATRIFAIHGFSFRIPATWELRVNKGYWGNGYQMFIDHRTPTLNLTWERFSRTPDYDRTVARMAKRATQHSDLKVTKVEPITGSRQGLRVRLEGSEGVFHAAVLRPDPDVNLVLVIRQMLPGSALPLNRLVDSSHALAEDAPTPWRFHGLALDLPPWWRLHGTEHMVGLTRAVWFHRPKNRLKTAGVLVLRRYACASRILREITIDRWIEERLEKRETMRQRAYASDGTFSAIADAPGLSPWRRLRGVREERHLAAWIEEGEDRLVVQEWKGAGPPLPPLRYPQDPKDGALPRMENT